MRGRGRPARDWSGHRHGMLTFVRPTDQRRAGYVVWAVRCDCGSEGFVSSQHISDRMMLDNCGCCPRKRPNGWMLECPELFCRTPIPK